MIPRRKTRQVRIGPVAVGDGAPISVQSMTNTPTADAGAKTAVGWAVISLVAAYSVGSPAPGLPVLWSATLGTAANGAVSLDLKSEFAPRSISWAASATSSAAGRSDGS